MSIGVFDSGVGGLSIHRALVERLPSADFLYLADQKNQPYGGAARRGDRRADPRRLRAAVRRGLQPGGPGLQHRQRHCAAPPAADLAAGLSPARSAGRSMSWASSCRPSRRPPACPGSRRSASRPTRLTRSRRSRCWACSPRRPPPGSRVYEIEIDKRRGMWRCSSSPARAWRALIELGAPREELAATIGGHVAQLTRTIGRPPDRAILGCTHYETRRRPVPRRPAGGLPADPPAAGHRRGPRPLSRPRMPNMIPGPGGGRRFLTTGEPGPQSDLVAAFWGAPLSFEGA